MAGTELQTPEAAQVDAVANMPRDLAIIKMENENIMALAAAHPRDHGAILDDIKNQLATYKSFAKEAMYCKPVGKDADGKMKYARGLSIRAAEALASSYKYNRSRIDVTPLGDDAARVEATFVDFQDGRVWQSSGVVSKTYKTRRGQIVRHNDDRFFSVVCPAEGSRRLRECICRIVPPGLRAELEVCVDEQLDGFLDDSTVKKIVAEFSNKGITQEQLEELLGKRLSNFTKEDRKTLMGVWNSIKEGTSTIAEVFGDANGKPVIEPPKRKSKKQAEDSSESSEQAEADHVHALQQKILALATFLPTEANKHLEAQGAPDLETIIANVQNWKFAVDLEPVLSALLGAQNALEGKTKSSAKPKLDRKQLVRETYNAVLGGDLKRRNKVAAETGVENFDLRSLGELDDDKLSQVAAAFGVGA